MDFESRTERATTTSDDIDDRYAHAAGLFHETTPVNANIQLQIPARRSTSHPTHDNQPSTCPTSLSGTRARAPTARAAVNGAYTPLRWNRLGGRSQFGGIFEGNGNVIQEEGKLTSVLSQPCLHSQGRSRPQVRPEHLPSVLP